MRRTVFLAVGGVVAVTTISAMHKVDMCHSDVATGLSGVDVEHNDTGVVVGATR